MGPRRGRFSSIGASYQTLPPQSADTPPVLRYTAQDVRKIRCVRPLWISVLCTVHAAGPPIATIPSSGKMEVAMEDVLTQLTRQFLIRCVRPLWISVLCTVHAAGPPIATIPSSGKMEVAMEDVLTQLTRQFLRSRTPNCDNSIIRKDGGCNGRRAHPADEAVPPADDGCREEQGPEIAQGADRRGAFRPRGKRGGGRRSRQSLPLVRLPALREEGARRARPSAVPLPRVRQDLHRRHHAHLLHHQARQKTIPTEPAPGAAPRIT